MDIKKRDLWLELVKKFNRFVSIACLRYDLQFGPEMSQTRHQSLTQQRFVVGNQRSCGGHFRLTPSVAGLHASHVGSAH